MNCCVNCFTSNYLINIITSNSKEKGKCDFCNSDDVELYDPKGLIYQFKNLIELYTTIDIKSAGLSIIPTPIEEQILKDFPKKIFNLKNPNKVKTLLDAIIEDEKTEVEELFSNPVFMKYLVDPIKKEEAEKLKKTWAEFSNEIKNENRFHLNNSIDLSKIKQLLERHTKKYSKDRVFYRARISSREGFDQKNMGKPPKENAKAGRANPEGIPYLYLSNDIDTTVFETRANLYDYVTIGEFLLKENLDVVNLRETELYDPIQLAEEEKLEDFLIHLPFVTHLERELSHPVRRNDNELDYIPTQYLSEFIKSLNYGGMEYRSSLNPNGYNLAIFNSDYLECVNVYVKEIYEINYKHMEI
jgi:hypothetical protein